MYLYRALQEDEGEDDDKEEDGGDAAMSECGIQAATLWSHAAGAGGAGART